MCYPNLKNEDPTLLDITTKDDDLKEVEYETEKHDHHKILKSFTFDNVYYEKKYETLNEKKIKLFITEFFIGSASTINSSILAILNPSVGFIISSSSPSLTSIAILISNDYISKLKMRFTKLRDWINVITLLYEKTLEQSTVDKKVDEKEVNEFKKIFTHYLDKKRIYEEYSVQG